MKLAEMTSSQYLLTKQVLKQQKARIDSRNRRRGIYSLARPLLYD
jgi:hypothetical protein